MMKISNIGGKASRAFLSYGLRTKHEKILKTLRFEQSGPFI
jgi:hypothetical protein